MGNIGSLHKVVDPTLLREAMKELGSAYGIKDKNTFVQLLLDKAATDDGKLHGDEIEDFDANPQLKELADTIISLQGNGKFGHEIIAAVTKFCKDAKGDDKVAKQLKDPPDKKDEGPFISITQSESVGENHKREFGFLRDHGIEDIIKDMGQDLKDGAKRQSVSVIEFHDPLLNFSNRDSAAAQIFLQALPSIEISRAVPYFDMKAIVKGAPFVENAQVNDDGFKFGNGISIYKFLSGERIETDEKTVRNLVSAIPVELSVPPPNLNGVAGQGKVKKPQTTEGSITVAGMEVFTSPQTMVRGDWQHQDLNTTDSNYGSGAKPTQIPQENKILDKFRPLMTIESFNVKVTPASGMLATKSADVKIKLHDKTRLNQVIPFIQPAKLGLCDIQIEWGWSHPETDPAKNPYGALINSMRCKELYGVMNSSYTFTPEGQVDITLKLFSKGAQRATFELVSNNKKMGKHPGDALKELVMNIRAAVKKLKGAGFSMNEEMGAPDVFGKTASVTGLLGLDEKKDLPAIQKFIDNMTKKSGKNEENKKAWQDLSTQFGKATEGQKAYHEQLEEGILKQIGNLCENDKGKTTNDPYLVEDTVKSPTKFGHKGNLFSIKHTTHVSLGKVLLEMVAKPLLATGQFNEVQMVFYPMNEFAMWARSLNVAQYPINKVKLQKRLTGQIKKTPTLTIQKLLNMIKKTFVNFTGDDIYGMSAAYSAEPNDDGKYEMKEDFTKDEKAKQDFSIAKSAVLSECYKGEGAEKRFKKPSIQMWVECVQHQDNPKVSILRLHFFDKACSSYSSYAQLWSSASSGDLGVIGKYANADKSVKKADKKLEKAPKKEKKKYEELRENRIKRRSKHEAHAKRQLKQFQDNGLIKPIKVKTKNDKNEEVVVTKYQIAGGPDQIRGILAANMPTLKYGTEFSGILNASLQTNSNPQMETIHMQRQGGQSGTSDGFDSGLPMSVKPVTLTIDTFGCPYVNFGQQFFVDFQTNTTIDDIYAVSGVSHSLSPSEFKSSITLSPLNKTGQFRNISDSFDDAVAVTEQQAERVG